MAETDDLNADVRAFAAQLGLGGGESVSDFSDFDPKKAQKRIGKPEKAAKKDAAPRKDAKAKPGPKTPAKDAGKRQAPPGNVNRHDKSPAAPINREAGGWKAAQQPGKPGVVRWGEWGLGVPCSVARGRLPGSGRKGCVPWKE